jgi:hypothetical protein
VFFPFPLLKPLSFAQAMLPPAPESARYIKAILNSQELRRAIPTMNWITSITQTKGSFGESGEYLVVADDCQAVIRVNPVSTDPPMMMPPLGVKILHQTCEEDEE